MWNADRGPLAWWRRTFGQLPGEEGGETSSLECVQPPAPPREWIDEDALFVQLGGDRELLCELARLFQEEHHRRMPWLRDALAAGQSEEVGKAAHGIKSGITNFCAPEAVALAHSIERAGKSGDLTGVEEGVEALEICLQEMEAQLARLVSAP